MSTPEHRAPLPSGAVPSEVLIIGCGNTLFGDDGIGPVVAERIGDRGRPGVLALGVHELTPELAADLAATGRAFFVDAALHGGEVECVPLAPCAQPAEHLGHALSPGELLALCRQAFGRVPPAWLVRVPAEDFTLGHPLSACAQSGIERALALLAARL